MTDREDANITRSRKKTIQRDVAGSAETNYQLTQLAFNRAADQRMPG